MSILMRPEFLLAALAIIATAAIALYVNGLLPGRRRRERARRAEHDLGSNTQQPTKRDPGEGDDSGLEIVSERPVVTFADVAGLDESVAELQELREYLAEPARFHLLGAELPRGVLLCGPPGNGKTLLARALAGEAGVPFHYVSAAAFVERYVGVGAARIRRLFDQARRRAPAIVFLDELDAVGRRRSSAVAGDREFDHTLNQLLTELDGFEGSSGVLIVGATNRPELLDSALVRPGRFDRRIMVDQPDRRGREAILRLYGSRRPCSRRIDWWQVAGQTAGLSGAELARVVNEAALLAARHQRAEVSADDLDEAITRLQAGPRRDRLLRDEDKRLIAYHESGHALVALLLRGIEPPARVSIVSRAGALTRSPWALPEDREVVTQRELMAQLMVLLAGRAAELAVFGEPSSRAEDDLREAASLARRMVERWAMTGEYELAGREILDDVSSWTPHGSDRAVRRLVDRAERGARTILADRADDLRRVADTLAEQETMELAAIAELTGQWAWLEERGDGGDPRAVRRQLQLRVAP
ncbi:MAG TPA: AAA family ATPase [Nitriliruptorales bacterium]|nr:AAA family ATPase [Nitriliruptorales bacterium]